MKIIIFWEQDSWGGVDSHLLTLLKTWPTLSDEFLILYNKGNPGFQRIRLELGELKNVQFKAINSWSYNDISARSNKLYFGSLIRRLLYFVQPILFYAMKLRLIRIFKRLDKTDVLLADNGGYPAAWGCLSAILAAKHVGIPCRILLVHHEACNTRLFMGWFEYYIDRAVTKAANAIVCPSYATRETLLVRREINTEIIPIRVISNEANIEDTSKCVNEVVDIRLLVSAGADISLVGIAGRIEPYKGHEDIICAMSRLPDKERQSIELVIIGEGSIEEIERLRSLSVMLGLDDNVHFVGYLEGNSIDIIRQLDLLVVATRSFEGYGLTLAEAISVKTPILSSSVGAVPEFINDDIGTLYPPSAPHELSKALISFINHREQWLKKAEFAHALMGKSVGIMSKEYRRVFNECRDFH